MTCHAETRRPRRPSDIRRSKAESTRSRERPNCWRGEPRTVFGSMVHLAAGRMAPVIRRVKSHSAALLAILIAVPAFSQPTAKAGDVIISAYRRDSFFGLPSSDVTVLDNSGNRESAHGPGIRQRRPRHVSSGIDQIAETGTPTPEMDLTMDAAGRIWTIGVLGHIARLRVAPDGSLFLASCSAFIT